MRGLPLQGAVSMAKRTDTATYDLKLALPLAAFFAAFFLAPLLILIFVSLHTDTSMARIGLTQYAKFLLDPFSLTRSGSGSR
jgi:putative spermidine/putrescine transport system permease protein